MDKHALGPMQSAIVARTGVDQICLLVPEAIASRIASCSPEANECGSVRVAAGPVEPGENNINILFTVGLLAHGSGSKIRLVNRTY